VGREVKEMRATSTSERGFSLIDVMIAMTILLVGVLALGAALTGALIRTEESEEELVAKQHATTATESIFSARDVATLGFAAAQNTTGTCTGGPGVFCQGARPIYSSAGPDGLHGTNDDTGTVVAGFTRQIEIADVNDADDDGMDDTSGFPVSLRRVTVTVFYRIRNAERQVRLTTFIGDYRYLN
jgi:type II secretory pathway pseudopilin PulG